MEAVYKLTQKYNDVVQAGSVSNPIEYYSDIQARKVAKMFEVASIDASLDSQG